jgi:hypothetical protein
MCASVCVCVCVCARARARAHACVYVLAHAACERAGGCACGRVQVCACVCVWGGGGEKRQRIADARGCMRMEHCWAAKCKEKLEKQKETRGIREKQGDMKRKVRCEAVTSRNKLARMIL